MNTPFDITKEEVLNLAAEKLVKAYTGDDLAEHAEKLVTLRVEKLFAEKLDRRIEEFLSQEMRSLLEKQIQPVDQWGEPIGNKTTIRDQLHKQAMTFWELKVDRDGKVSSWGTPRWQWLFCDVVQKQFADAVKENAHTVAKALRDTLKSEATKLAHEHIESFFKNIK